MPHRFWPGLLLLASVMWCGRVEAERSQKLRVRGAEVYYTDAELRAVFAKKHPGKLPAWDKKLPKATDPAFDWTKLVPPTLIRSQGKSPNCWAFAALTAFEYNWQIRNGAGTVPPLSVQPVVDRLGKDGFGAADQAFAELLAHGTCPVASYPGDGTAGTVRSGVKMPYRAIAWGTVWPQAGPPWTEPPVQDLKESLLEHGPFTSLIQLTPALKAYRGGVFNEHYKPPADAPRSTHIVTIVGWDDRRGKAGCWKVQNSWGPRWGEGGFMWIEYGCNDIGHAAVWVRAQATHYQLPKDIHRSISETADPFPAPPAAVAVTAPPPAQTAPLSPVAALKTRGERVQVLFPVVDGAIDKKSGRLDLYSEGSWRDPNCLTLRFDGNTLARFNASGPGSLLSSLKGHRVLVTGYVEPNPTRIGDRPIIEVYDPSRLKIFP